MDYSSELCPVVETPWYEELPWLWPVAKREPHMYMPLSGDLSDNDVGLVFGQLVSYNDIEEREIETLQHALINADKLILPGGLRIRSGEYEILPACCCGLEDWREWERFLQEGLSPWLGHDPAPWAELVGDSVRIWSDGGSEPAPDAFAVEFARSHFEVELSRVENDLRAFVERVERWAHDIGFSAPDAVRRTLEQQFLTAGA